MIKSDTKLNIQSISCLTSIAVVRAISSPDSAGLAVFCNILRDGLQGVLYPFSPNAKSVLSVKAYPKLMDIPDETGL